MTTTENNERRVVQSEQLINLKKQLDTLTKEVKEFKQIYVKIQELDDKISHHIETEKNIDIPYIKQQFEEIQAKITKIEELKIQMSEVRTKLTLLENSLPVRMDVYEVNQKKLIDKHASMETSMDVMIKQYDELKENHLDLTEKVNELLLAKLENKTEHQVLINQLNDAKPKVDEIYEILLVWKGFSKMISWISENAKKVSAIIALVVSLVGGGSMLVHYVQSNFIIQTIAGQ